MDRAYEAPINMEETKRKTIKDENIANMTIEERTQAYFDILKALGNNLGLTVAVPHGEDLILYDLWERKPLKLKINRGINIKKQDGEVTVEEFDRGK